MPVTVAGSLAPSGKFFVARFASGGSDAILQAINATPTVMADGVPLTLGTPVWGPNDSGAGPGSGGAPYLPWAAWPIAGGPVSGSAAVRLSAASGAFTTSAGPSPTLASAACANLGGGSLLPAFDASTPRVMRQGWNLGPPSIDTDAFPTKRNYATRIQAWSGATGLTPNGYPTGFTSQGYATASIANCPTNGVDGKGRPNCPPSATWTVAYTTPPSGQSVSLAADGPGDTCTAGTTTTSGPDTVRTFAIVGGGVLNSPNVQVATTVVGDCNLRITCDGLPVNSSQVYHQAWLDIAAGASCLRTVTAVDFGGGGNVGEWEDFRPATHLSDDMPTKTVGGTIVSISPGTDSTGWIGLQVPIFVTFAAPHGINSGMLVPFSITGSFLTTQGNPVTIYGLQWARRVSATEIMVAGQIPNGADPYSLVLATTYNNPGTWTCVKEIKPGRSPADVIAQANANHSDLWMPVPCGLSDAGCQALFALIATTLDPGLKLRCEYTNEAWNNQFGGFTYCQNLSYSLGVGTTEAYAIRAGQVHAFAATAFSDAGRANDLVRVLGSQAGNATLTADLLGFAAAHSLPVDAVAVAPYIDNGPFNGPAEPTLIATWGSLDDDQRMDLAELYARDGHWDSIVAPHKSAILASAYPSAKLVGYEGGLQFGPSIGATQISLTDSQKTVHCSLGWSKHPRARGIVLYLMDLFQANGMEDIAIFQLTGRTEGYADALGANWSVIPAFGVVPGRGDGTDGLASNLTIGPSGLPWEDYRPGHLVSVYAGALAYWRSLLPGGTPTPTPTLCPVLFTRAA